MIIAIVFFLKKFNLLRSQNFCAWNDYYRDHPPTRPTPQKSINPDFKGNIWAKDQVKFRQKDVINVELLTCCTAHAKLPTKTPTTLHTILTQAKNGN